jgi:hypothetical protein
MPERAKKVIEKCLRFAFLVTAQGSGEADKIRQRGF